MLAEWTGEPRGAYESHKQAHSRTDQGLIPGKDKVEPNADLRAHAMWYCSTAAYRGVCRSTIESGNRRSRPIRPSMLTGQNLILASLQCLRVSIASP